MSSASFPSLIFVMLIFWMKYEVNCIPNDFFCKPSDVECLIMMDWDGIEPTSSKNMKEYDNNKLRNQSNDNGGAPRHAEFVPHSPLIPCNRLPRDFLMCTKNRASAGGDKKSGQRYEDVYQVYSNCQVLNGIACYGDRVFVRQNTFQVKYTGHYFLTTLLYSILLGFLGLDRFSIGHTGTAIGKLLTLGGLGIWWIVDIVLLITGNLMPEDGSNWTPIA